MSEDITTDNIDYSVSCCFYLNFSSSITVIILSVNSSLNLRNSSIQVINYSPKISKLSIHKFSLFNIYSLFQCSDFIHKIIIFYLINWKITSSSFKINLQSIWLSSETIDVCLNSFNFALNVCNCVSNVS